MCIIYPGIDKTYSVCPAPKITTCHMDCYNVTQCGKARFFYASYSTYDYDEPYEFLMRL